jgi:lipopolysaccharide transport LptD-like protein
MPPVSAPARSMRGHRRLARLARTLLVSGLLSAWIGAAPGWGQPAGAPGGLTVSAGGEEASVVADQIQQVGGTSDLLIAVGNVEITRGQSRLLADRVELNRDTGQAVAQGKVVFYDGPDRLVGERIDYNLKTGTGVVYNGSAVAAPYYHLSAERMDRIGDSVYEVRRGVFNAKTVAGPDQTPVRWEMVRFTLSQTYKVDPVAQPLKDLYGDLTIQPNQRIGFHADARYNVYNLGLREANADVRLVYPRVSVAVGPCFNEQGSSRYLRAETLVRVLSNPDVRGATAWDVLKGRAIENRIGIDWRFSCWSVTAEYVNRHNDESEFRFMVNLLGVGQVGTSARAGF